MTGENKNFMERLKRSQTDASKVVDQVMQDLGLPVDPRLEKYDLTVEEDDQVAQVKTD